MRPVGCRLSARSQVITVIVSRIFCSAQFKHCCANSRLCLLTAPMRRALVIISRTDQAKPKLLLKPNVCYLVQPGSSTSSSFGFECGRFIFNRSSSSSICCTRLHRIVVAALFMTVVLLLAAYDLVRSNVASGRCITIFIVWLARSIAALLNSNWSPSTAVFV